VFERAAMKFLRRYLDEKDPTLKNFAKVVRGKPRSTRMGQLAP
jgi:hypothetical protein